MIDWLAQNAVAAALLAGIVALACRLGRFRPAIQHALWLVVLLKLMCPPLVSWPWELSWLPRRLESPLRVAAGAAPSSASHKFVTVGRCLNRTRYRPGSPRGAALAAAPARGRPSGGQRREAERPGSTSSASPAAGSPASGVSEVSTSEVLAPSRADFPAAGEFLELLDSARSTAFEESMEPAESPRESPGDCAARALPEDRFAVGMGSGDEPFSDGGRPGPLERAPAAPEAVVADPGSERFSVFEIPVAVWLLPGALVALFLEARRSLRARALLAHGRAAPAWFRAEVGSVAREMRVRAPEVVIIPGNGSPFIWSLGVPKLLVPGSLLERLEPRVWKSVMAHELAHLRRRDHWVGWLLFGGAGLWWWNPVYWYVRRRLRLTAEFACDAWVTHLLPDERRRYAESLIEITRFVSEERAPLPALGASNAARQAFERRLHMILRTSHRARLSAGGMAGVGLLALLALPGWSQEAGPAEVSTSAPRAAEGVSGEYAEAESERPAPAPSVEEAAGDAEEAPASPSPTARDPLLPGEPLSARPVEAAESLVARLAKREKRLLLLEKKLEDLLARTEIMMLELERSLEGLQQNVGSRPSRAGRRRSSVGTPRNIEALATPSPSSPSGLDVLVGKTITVPYDLPDGKARALASFLKAQTGERLGIRQRGDTLWVSGSVEDQNAIDGFIRLLASGKRPPRRPTSSSSSSRRGVEPSTVDIPPPAPPPTRISTGVGAPAVRAVASTRVQALVEAVDREEKVVVLSVGTDQRVRLGDRFTIRREGKSVGEVEVTKLYRDLCAARFRLVAEGQEIRRGDRAERQSSRRPSSRGRSTGAVR